MLKLTKLTRILHAAESGIFGNHIGAKSVDGCMHHAHPHPHHHPTQNLVGPQDWIDDYVLRRYVHHDSSNLAGLFRHGGKCLTSKRSSFPLTVISASARPNSGHLVLSRRYCCNHHRSSHHHSSSFYPPVLEWQLRQLQLIPIEQAITRL
jgi:hypothetical protein